MSLKSPNINAIFIITINHQYPIFSVSDDILEIREKDLAYKHSGGKY